MNTRPQSSGFSFKGGEAPSNELSKVHYDQSRLTIPIELLQSFLRTVTASDGQLVVDSSALLAFLQASQDKNLEHQRLDCGDHLELTQKRDVEEFMHAAAKLLKRRPLYEELLQDQPMVAALQADPLQSIVPNRPVGILKGFRGNVIVGMDQGTAKKCKKPFIGSFFGLFSPSINKKRRHNELMEQPEVPIANSSNLIGILNGAGAHHGSTSSSDSTLVPKPVVSNPVPPLTVRRVRFADGTKRYDGPSKKWQETMEKRNERRRTRRRTRRRKRMSLQNLIPEEHSDELTLSSGPWGVEEHELGQTKGIENKNAVEQVVDASQAVKPPITISNEDVEDCKMSAQKGSSVPAADTGVVVAEQAAGPIKGDGYCPKCGTWNMGSDNDCVACEWSRNNVLNSRGKPCGLCHKTEPLTLCHNHKHYQVGHWSDEKPSKKLKGNVVE